MGSILNELFETLTTPTKFHFPFILLLTADLADPAPKLAADSKEILKEVKSPVLSHPGGFKPGPLMVTIASPTPGATVYYTTDGSEPFGFIDDRSLLPYDHSPISINSTTVLRARAFKFGYRPSRIVTHTYFVDERATLPTVSLVTDPMNLWDRYEGIYVSGADRNFEKDWEKPAHLELFESSSDRSFAMDIGLSIHGGWSRRLPQKSLAVFSRKSYGPVRISYRLFPNNQISSYKSFILRNSGNDWAYTMLRDAMMQTLVKERMDIDFQEYRPVVVFLNGEYWGIHNLRENINRHYIESLYGIDGTKVDMLEGDGTVLEGDARQYNAMIKFLESSDLTRPESYDQLKRFLDVDEYINYQIAQIYFGNTDWFGDNIKYWRAQETSGRWRWILFDTDYGFNLPRALNPSPPHHNTLKMAADSFLFARILENPRFKNEFIQRFSGHLNTTFKQDRVIRIIDSLQVQIAPELPRHISRWRDFPAPYYGYPFSSVEEWEGNIEELRSFARKRADYIRRHISRRFELESPVTVHLEGDTDAGGRVQINGVTIDSLPWSGSYFPNVPISLKALPDPGHTFAGWEVNPGKSPIAAINLTGDFSAEVRFTALNPLNVFFSEINYHSLHHSDPGDWVEIYNAENEPIDMSGWHFLDMNDAHDFVVPENTLVEPLGYIVLCQDSTKFGRYYPDLSNYVGAFEFGLSNGGELIRLRDSAGAMVDSLSYDDRHPWPVKPDGTGSTLAFKATAGDNGTYLGWVAAAGTPGAANALHDTSDFRVDLFSAYALAYRGTMYLTWTAGLESQNQGFKIARSVNGGKFAPVASYERDGRLQGRLVGSAPVKYVWVDENVEFGNTYSYLISACSIQGETERYSDHILTGEVVAEKELKFDRFLINFPNPFHYNTTLSFGLPKKAVISLRIFNVAGEKVVTLIRKGMLEEGEYVLKWNGRNDSGIPVSSGLYFAWIKSNDVSVIRKMLLVK